MEPRPYSSPRGVFPEKIKLFMIFLNHGRLTAWPICERGAQNKT